MENTIYIDILDDCIEMIGTLDDEETKEIKETLRYYDHPSLGMTLFWTFVLSGPILTGFVRGVNSKLHIVLIAASSVLLTIDWVLYILGHSRRPEYQKIRNKGSLWIFPAVIASIIIILLAFSGLSILQEKWIANVLGSKWLFYEDYRPATILLIIAASFLVVQSAIMLLFKATGNNDYESGSDIIKFLWNHRISTVIVLIILIYIGTISVTAVTEDEIVKFSAVHPMGRSLSFKDIDSVETGFSKRGAFYYKLKVDNRTIKFETPITNTEIYPEDDDDYSYKELVDFDARLMALGIPKTADADSIQYADYSEDCMKKFEAIMNSTGEQTYE